MYDALFYKKYNMNPFVTLKAVLLRNYKICFIVFFSSKFSSHSTYYLPDETPRNHSV